MSKRCWPPLTAFQAFRGVSGMHPTRRTYGFSWSMSCDQACWFALRGGFAEPEVYATTIRRRDILAFVDRGGTREIVVHPAKAETAALLPLTIDELHAGQRRWELATSDKV